MAHSLCKWSERRHTQEGRRGDTVLEILTLKTSRTREWICPSGQISPLRLQDALNGINRVSESVGCHEKD
uniref:Uncharacterized protein n=1 Tax=Anguilla anguilla TaxID=7936 RepID=A0A0E9U2S9_ANGAN